MEAKTTKRSEGAEHAHVDCAGLLFVNVTGVGFEVLTAVSTNKAVFWVVAPCSLVEVYQRFRGPCCLHHQGD
jgi:hypothetical protein